MSDTPEKSKSPYVITPAGKAAGRLVRDMRSRRGLSTTALSDAIAAAGLGYVSRHTLRRIENGVTPRVRVQYAVATFFDKEVPDVWPSQPVGPARRPVPKAQTVVAA